MKHMILYSLLKTFLMLFFIGLIIYILFHRSSEDSKPFSIDDCPDEGYLVIMNRRTEPTIENLSPKLTVIKNIGGILWSYDERGNPIIIPAINSSMKDLKDNLEKLSSGVLGQIISYYMPISTKNRKQKEIKLVLTYDSSVPITKKYFDGLGDEWRINTAVGFVELKVKQIDSTVIKILQDNKKLIRADVAFSISRLDCPIVDWEEVSICAKTLSGKKTIRLIIRDIPKKIFGDYQVLLIDEGEETEIGWYTFEVNMPILAFDLTYVLMQMDKIPSDKAKIVVRSKQDDIVENLSIEIINRVEMCPNDRRKK